MRAGTCGQCEPNHATHVLRTVEDEGPTSVRRVHLQFQGSMSSTILNHVHEQRAALTSVTEMAGKVPVTLSGGESEGLTSPSATATPSDPMTCMLVGAVATGLTITAAVQPCLPSPLLPVGIHSGSTLPSNLRRNTV